MKIDREKLREKEMARITVAVQNIGQMEGEETVFLFSSHHCETVFQPEKELRGFRKLRLKPGETGSAEFVLKAEDLAFYNTAIHDW
jgi:beta-glucosidase